MCLRLLSLPNEVRGPSELLKPVAAALLEAAREQAALNAPAQSLAGGGPDGSVHCMEALWIEPLGGRYSRFFGQSEVRTPACQCMPTQDHWHCCVTTVAPSLETRA